MNKRLEAIRRLIPAGRGMIDVGTDHGYLPVQLYKDGYGGRIFASDIRSGPLAAARRTAERAGASDSVFFILCDGLEAAPSDGIDTIVIAGMGGDTICGILDRAEWCMSPDYYLILQPMTKAEILRFWLVNNGFAIDEEDLVEDGGTIYQIFCARFSGENTALSDAELYLGVSSLIGSHPLFPAFLRQQRARMRTRIEGMLAGGRCDRGQLSLYQSILKEMDEREGEQHDHSQ